MQNFLSRNSQFHIRMIKTELLLQYRKCHTFLDLLIYLVCCKHLQKLCYHMEEKNCCRWGWKFLVMYVTSISKDAIVLPHRVENSGLFEMLVLNLVCFGCCWKYNIHLFFWFLIFTHFCMFLNNALVSVIKC